MSAFTHASIHSRHGGEPVLIETRTGNTAPIGKSVHVEYGNMSFALFLTPEQFTALAEAATQAAQVEVTA